MPNAIDAHQLALKVNKIIESQSPVILFIGKKCKSIDNTIIDKPWSSIVTTLQKEELLYDFTIENKRRVFAIDDYDNMLKNARLSQRELNVIYLYGYNEISYLSTANKRRRDQEAASMLKMLPEMVKGNFGCLIITGYGDSDDDELDFPYLFDTLEQMRNGSVYMFGVSDSLWHNELFIELQKDGKIEAVSEDLSDLLRNIDIPKSSIEEYSYQIDQDSNTVFFYINGKRTTIGIDVLFDSKGFVSFLSETEIGDTSCPSYLKADYFYNFLRNSPHGPVWYGYDNNFYLTRRFELTLNEVVKTALQSSKDTENAKPILLSGQTSSSKSMALGNLAFAVYSEKTYPVLYVKNPDIHLDKDSANFVALDMLLQELENRGARRILLIWDNSSAFDQRHEVERLYINLQNRGRKVVLVCSGYNYDDSSDTHKFIVVNSEIELSPDEFNELRELVIMNGGISGEEFDNWSSAIDNNNLLALLYNLLHEHIGEEIVRGIGRETDFGMSKFFIHLNKKFTDGKKTSAMTDIGMALQNAGFKLTDFSGADDESQQAYELEQKILNFFVTVAVSSQYKIALPFYMALRSLKLDMDNRFAAIQRAIENVPCLKISPTEPDGGSFDYLISFRTPLEASLYLKSAGITPEQEIDYIAKLIIDTSGSGEYSRFNETSIVDRIIRIIGPNSGKIELRRKYSQYYYKIVDALTKLRTEYKLDDPRLICQEVTWLREIYGVPNLENADFSYVEKKSKLESAIKLARTTLEKKVSSWAMRNDRARGSLLVEQVLCELRLYELACKNSDNLIPLTFDYRTLFSQLSASIGSDPTNMYRRNALMKLFFVFYRNDISMKDEKLEYFSKILSIVDAWDIQTGELFDDEYNRHILELKEIENQNAYDLYFDELLKRGNAVGVHLKARNMLKNANINLKKKIAPNQYKLLQEIVDFINNYVQVTKTHQGCQYMLLNLMWLLYNKGNPPFSGDEKQRTFMNAVQWREILAICKDYEQQFMRGTEQPVNMPTMYYLLALSYAQLEEFSKSLDIFKQVERVAGFYTPVRNKVWHLLCDEKGHTKKFRGTLEEKFYDHRKKKGRIRVDKIGGVYFYGPSLKLPQFSGAYTDIEIGISYIGFEAFRKLEE